MDILSFRLTKIVSVSIVQMLSPGEPVYYTYANAYACNKLKKLQVISKSQPLLKKSQ